MGRSGSDHQPHEERSPDKPPRLQGVGGGSSERLLGSDLLEYEEMGGGLRNLRGKTGRNPLDSINREKRIHEPPSHFNLALDFIGSISKNRVFQCELSITTMLKSPIETLPGFKKWEIFQTSGQSKKISEMKGVNKD